MKAALKNMSRWEVMMLLRPTDAARIMGVSRAMVYRLIDQGRLPAVQLSQRCLRIPMKAIEQLVDQAMEGHNAGGQDRGSR